MSTEALAKAARGIAAGYDLDHVEGFNLSVIALARLLGCGAVTESPAAAVSGDPVLCPRCEGDTSAEHNGYGPDLCRALMGPLPALGTARYRSPLRPLDIGYASRIGGVAIDWDACDAPGPWTRDRVYAFASPLPGDVVVRLELEHA